MARDKDLGRGAEVSWSSHGHTVEGTVERKLTERTEAAGRTVHTPEALHRGRGVRGVPRR